MSEPTAPRRNLGWVRQLIDFGALVVFAASYFLTRDLILAGWVLVVSSAIAVTAGLIIERRIAPLPTYMGVVALLFGTMAVVFHDATFIKLKFTAQNGALALVLLGSLPFRKYPFKMIFGEVFAITEAGWRLLTLRYGLYFATIALANEAVWRTQTDATWVKFRVGAFFVAIIFGTLQIFLLRKHLVSPEDIVDTTPDPGL